MWLKGRVVIAGLVLGLLGAGAVSAADDPPADNPEPAAESAGTTEAKEKVPFAMYFEVGRGLATTDDIDTSLESLSTHLSTGSIKFENEFYSRAALGWKFQKNKGDVRLRFTGYREDGYVSDSVGFQTGIDPTLPAAVVTDPLEWWRLHIENGLLEAQRTPPHWLLADDDLNGNGVVDPEEVTYPGPDITVTRQVADDLQNTAQHVDLLYGREFGKRRYSARWWGGVRYFQYEGNIPVAAWLSTSSLAGEHYTDGALLRPLVFHEESSGFGPTGSLEADFNFFEKRLTLYLQGSFAFVIMDVQADTAPFYTLASNTTAGGITPIPAQLSTSLSKSTWQNAAEAGLRVRLKSGFGLELAYTVEGFLDVIALPNRMRIPENVQEAPQGTSATNRTHDYVVNAWRLGISYQF